MKRACFITLLILFSGCERQDDRSPKLSQLRTSDIDKRFVYEDGFWAEYEATFMSYHNGRVTVRRGVQAVTLIMDGIQRQGDHHAEVTDWLTRLVGKRVRVQQRKLIDGIPVVTRVPIADIWFKENGKSEWSLLSNVLLLQGFVRLEEILPPQFAADMYTVRADSENSARHRRIGIWEKHERQ